MRWSAHGLLAAAVAGVMLAAGHELGPQVTNSAWSASAAERQPLYYQDPTGKPAYSPTPKKDATGREYVPVYEEPSDFAAKQAAQPAAPKTERKILYYRNPMG